MRVRAASSALCAAALVCSAAASAKKSARPMPGEQKIRHALNRLTFGPRPGDEDAVRRMGLKKWIDAQLHPERIRENPALAAKLKPLDTLHMSTAELVRNYPTPQMARQMVNGQAPFPSDPERRRMVQKLAARFGETPQTPKLQDVLTPREIRGLRQGTPTERMAALRALPADKQDEVIAALPGGMRQQLFVAAPPDLRRRIEIAGGGPQQIVVRDLMEAKLLRAVESNRQLEEVLTDFWYNHFNVFLDKGVDRYLVTSYERDAIRPRVLGKFRDLLEATAKSPAMLFYLDNWQSVGPDSLAGRASRGRRGLNENYGRELMELHTLGVDGGYTQKDVTELARCFTGWTIAQPQRGAEFVFNARMHDQGEKTVLGVKIPAGGGIEDGERALDILARHPSTARFISKELAQRFVSDDPPASLVDHMAKVFLKTEGDLRAVMKTMLDSKEFWDGSAYGAKVKSPLEMVASAVRAVDGDVDFAFPLANQVAQSGEPLYRKIEPTGYPNVSAEWLNSAGLVARMNFAVQLANGRIPGVQVRTPVEAVVLGSPEFQKK